MLTERGTEMPFKSKAQQRMMFAQHPVIAKRFAKETPNMKSLPARAAKKTARKATKKGGRR